MMESDRLVCGFCCLDWWFISSCLFLLDSPLKQCACLFPESLSFLVSIKTSRWWTFTLAAYSSCRSQIYYRFTRCSNFSPRCCHPDIHNPPADIIWESVIRKPASADNWLFSCFNEDSELVEYFVPDVTHVYASGSDKAGRGGGWNRTTAAEALSQWQLMI